MSVLRRWLSAFSPAVLAVTLLAVPLTAWVIIKWLQIPLPYGQVLAPDEPDSWMRLTLVRELITSHDWYNHAVPRNDAPFFHSVNHWTRPVDVVLAVLAELQPRGDLPTRLLRAALLLPFICTILLLLGLFRILKKIDAQPLTPFVAVAFVACVPLLGAYFQIGNADHHAPLAVIFVWALAIVFERPSRRTTILSGLLLALLVWISAEGLVLIAAVYGWYGLHWAFGQREKAQPLPLLSAVVAIGSAAAVMIERPPALWFSPAYDVISIVFVTILAYAAAIVALLWWLRPSTFAGRAALGVLSAMGLYGLLFAYFPLMLQGSMAEVDPYIFTNFLPHIREAQSPANEPPAVSAALLIQPIAGFLIMLYCLATRREALPATSSLALAYFLTATFALFLSQVRFAYYFYPMLTLALAPWVAALLEPNNPAIAGRWPASWLARYPTDRQALRRLPIIVFARWPALSLNAA